MTTDEIRTEWNSIDPELKSLALEKAANGIVITDRDATILWANPAVERMTGYTPAELIGTTPSWLKANEQPATFFEELWRTIVAGQTWHGDLTSRRKDGSTYVEEVRIAPIVNEQGDVTQFVAVMQDVTEQRRVEKALERSEERFRLLTENAQDVVFRWIARPERRFEYVSPSIEALTGYTPEELYAEPDGGLVLAHPEDVPKMRAAIAEGETFSFTARWVHKAGRVVWVEQRGRTFRDEEGRVVAVESFARSIDDLRQAWDSLEQAQTWWRSVLENGTDLVSVNDAEGNVTYVSPSVERILGYSPEELVGRSGFELVHPEDVERIRQGFREKTGRTTPNAPVEMRFRHKSGAWRHLEATSTNALEDPNVRGMIVNARDVTDRVRADRQRRLLESVVVNTRDSVLITDTDLGPSGPRILYANPAFLSMSGYVMDEVLGNTPRMLQGEGTDREELDRIRCALDARTPVRAELVNYGKDGREYLIELEIAPVLNEMGEVTHFISVQRDITERRAQELRTLRFQEFRRNLAAIADEALASSVTPAFFKKIIDSAVLAVPAAQAGSLLVRQDDASFKYVAVQGFDERLLEWSLPLAAAFPPLTDREPVLRRGYEASTPGISPEALDVLFGEGVRSGDITGSMNVPVWVEDKLIAIFNLDTFDSRQGFTDDDLDMGRMFGRQVGLILQRLNLERILVEQANTDTLTGLPNRRRGEDLLLTAIDRAKDGEHPGAFCLLDLDNFKAINDAYGHAVGDAVMQAIARRLKVATEAFGVVARWSGDEFMVICSQVNGIEALKSRARELIDGFRAPVEIGHASIRVGVSMGIVVIPDHGHEVGDTIQNAHIALHHTKNVGSGGFTFYSPELRDAVTRRSRIDVALREAVNGRKIALHYQPRLDLRHERITSVEALARWHDEELGFVPPDEFIVIAEETDLIHDLGRLVLDQACRQARQWLERGTPRSVAVNVSLKQLQKGDLLDDVREVLGRHRLPPQWLELEITESAAMTDVETTLNILFELHDLGVALSIDDFGTAYSSLAYLKLLPIDALKIDRSFIMNLGDDPSVSSTDASIVQAIIALAKSMSLKVIAEGVETEAQRDFLELLGCDEGQGYLWSKPVPAEEL